MTNVISLRTREPVHPVVRLWRPTHGERVIVCLSSFDGEAQEFAGRVLSGSVCGAYSVQPDNFVGRPIAVSLDEMRPEPKGAA